MLLACGLAAARWNDRREIDSAERARLASQAFAIEQNLGRELVGVHAALRGVRASMVGWPEDQRVNFTVQRFRALCDAMPGVRSMHWLDASGRVLASSLPQAIGSSVGRRAYFRDMRARPDPGVLYVSEPFVTLFSGVFTLNLSVVIVDGDGGFGGALAATLDPDYFNPVLAAARGALPDDNWTVAALHLVTTITGSGLLALALLKRWLTADQVWSAAFVDEDWNIEKWGLDEEVATRRAARQVDFRAAVHVLEALAQPTP